MAPRPRSSRPNQSFPAAGLALLLIAVWYGVAVSSIREKSITFDEPLHITAGYSWIQEGDFRLDPEAGLLAGSWSGLALLASGAVLDTQNEYWKGTGGWALAKYFLGEWNDGKTLVWRARAANALFGCLLAFLVFAWARELFGTPAGFFSLLLYLFSPTVVAHARLVTADIVAALCFLAAMWSLGRALERPSPGRVMVSALSASALLLAKFSGVLYAPMALVLVTIHCACHPERLKAARHVLAIGGAQVAVALVVIWAAYGFRYSAFSDPAAHFDFGWDFMLRSQALPIVALTWLRSFQLLPEAWLYGLGYALHYSGGRLAFMAGQYSVEGWFGFFPFAFWVKTPLPIVGTLLLAVAAAFHRLQRSPAAQRSGLVRAFALRTAPLWVLLAVYLAAAVVFRMNVGHRHLLPIYPVLFILAGGLFSTAAAQHLVRFRALGVLLLCWTGVAFAATYPHYLSFFSLAAGGSEQGHHRLVDSSLDWGQDLPAFKHWIDENRRPDEVVYLSYFGTALPRREGIDAVLLNGFRDPPRHYRELGPGIYGISATMLQALYLPAKGPWSRPYERHFRLLHSVMQSPTNVETLEQQATEAEVAALRSRYDELRFSKLCHYLRNREPLAWAGGSILIYRLGPEDLAEAMAPLEIASLPEIPDTLVRWVPVFFK